MILTIGHSTRTADELIALLRAHDVALVVDVRRFPASRRHPHFAREPLSATLAAAGIDYAWEPALGGRRSRRPGSPHTAWRVAAFAGYADHMDTPEFQSAAHELIHRGTARRTAILCAEALPHQCHRRLIADWLTVQGVAVGHIVGRSRLEPHALPDFARVVDRRIFYDAGQPSLL